MHFRSLFCLIFILFTQNTNFGKGAAIDTSDAIFSFKALQMFFNEPYLAKLRVNNFSMEGAEMKKMSSFIIDLIKRKIDAKNGSNSKLLDFKCRLENGIEIMKAIATASSELEFLPAIAQAKPIQDDLLEKYLNIPGSSVIIPFHWNGPAPHAICIQIDRLEGDKFDLTILNSGDGVNYHLAIPCQLFPENDWRRIYPYTYRLWMEFKNIPRSEIFDSETAWFIAGLVYMQSSTFMINAALVYSDLNTSVSDYFYGSFLVNFVDYLRPALPDNSIIHFQVLRPEFIKSFVPAQKSGSCTMSSLLAALQYNSGDLAIYYRQRLILGFAMVEDFFERFGSSVEMVQLLADGSETIARNLFKKLSFAMALNLTKYLEEIIPKFQNSALLGVGRSQWLEKSKIDSLAVLEQDSETQQYISSTVKFCKKIHCFLKSIKFYSGATDLKKISPAADDNIKKISWNFSWPQVDERSKLSNNVFQELELVDQGRLFTQNISLEAFAKCISSVGVDRYDDTIYSRIADEIQALPDDLSAPSLWSNMEARECLDIMDHCNNIILSFIDRDHFAASLENVLLIGKMVIITWYAAVRYDNIHVQSPDNHLGLDQFSVPILSFLQVLNSGNKLAVCSPGILKKGGISINFDVSTISKIGELRKYYDESKVEFLNLNEILRFDSNRDYTYTGYFSSFLNEVRLLNHINENSKRKLIFDQIINCHSPQINTWKLKDENRSKFRRYNPDLVNIILILTENFSEKFPHFFKFIEILFNSHYALQFTKLRLETSKFRSSKLIHSYGLEYAYRKSCVDPVESVYKTIRNVYSKCHFHESVDAVFGADIFYSLRHSAIFFDEGLSQIGFEYWLSYVKGAVDSTIFARNSQFCITSDIVLNVPRLKAVESLNLNDLFFSGFKISHYEEVTNELFRLISSSFLAINQKEGTINFTTQNNLIYSAVNIGIILAKFISKCSYYKLIEASDAASKLSNLYNAFYNMIKSDSEIFLDDQSIALINLVMTLICDQNHIDQKTFLSNAQLSKNAGKNSVTDVFMKTMARYHWFIVRRLYKLSNSSSENENLTEKVYQHGFLCHKVEKEEYNFLSFILSTEFIHKHKLEIIPSINTECHYRIHYSSEENFLNIAKITFYDREHDKLVSENDFHITLQFTTGLVYYNNFKVFSIASVTNSEYFRDFFNTEEARIEALRGSCIEIAGKYLFYLPNYIFEGNDVALYFDNNEKKNNFAFRRIDRKWYCWEKVADTILDEIKFKKWLEKRRIYRRYLGESAWEIFFMADLDKYPSIKLFHEEGFIDISIGNLEKGLNEKWYLLREDYKLCKSLTCFGFEDKIMVLSKEETDIATIESLLIIYPGMRLKSIPEYPLVLKEKNSGLGNGLMEMKLLNSLDMTVIPDQTVNGKIQIPYTLIVQNDDLKKFILVPQTEISDRRIRLKYISSKKLSNLTQLELIPIFEGKLAPQSRLQKLLLAYYHILAYEYNIARKLLQYIKSIDINNPFNEEEISIIEWIVCIDEGGPEAEALKLLIYTQFEMSRIKFPIQTEHNSLFEEASRIFIMKYIGSIREVNDKFYIHEMVPEILDMELFDRVFKFESPSIKYLKLESNCKEQLPNVFKYLGQNPHKNVFNYKFEAFEGKDIKYFTDSLSVLIEIMTKLCHKRSKDSPEMLLFGFIENRKLWKEMEQKYNQITTTSDEQKFISSNSVAVKSLIDKCGKYFHGIDESITIEADKTILLSIMQSDKNLKCEKNDSTSNFDVNVVAQSHIDLFDALQKSLISFINTEERDVIQTLNQIYGSEVLQKIPVLCQLEASMSRYSSSNSAKLYGEIDISSKQTELIVFLSKVDEHKHNIEERIIQLVCSLESKRIEESEHARNLEIIFSYLHEKKEKTYEHLYGCYQNQSISCVQRKFPGLSLNSCMEVLKLTSEMYSLKVLLDLMNYVKSAAETLSIRSASTSIDDVELFCEELKKINDLNRRLQDPTLLNFEYRSGKYRLRTEQVNDIKLLTELEKSTNNFKSIVIQRMMAAGKTLVLGTIAVIKKAMIDQTKLSILVPPSSLYQSNTTAMQARTYNFFKKHGKTLKFPRFEMDNFSIIESYLKYVLRTFYLAMEERNYLILSPNDLQSFQNSYIEALNHSLISTSTHLSEVLKLYATIYQFFRDKSSIILDEIDLTMDPHMELNFPTCECEFLNMKAAVLISDLIELATLSQEIRLNCGLNIHENEQYGLTDAGFECVKSIWIAYIRNELLTEGDSIWKTQLLYNSKGCTLDAEEVFNFLKMPIVPGEGMEWIEQIESEKDYQLAHTLIIIRSQIHDKLRGNFKGSVNQSYGFGGGQLRPGLLYAVPYIAANTPSPNSIFADRWETLAKTLLMYASVPCQKEIAIKMIPYIRSSILNNLRPGIEEKDTIIGKICFNLFHEALKERSPLALRLLFSFALDEVLSAIKFPVEQITSNSLNMVSMFSSIQGYTGTLSNVAILPHETVENSYLDNLENENKNGGIARKLMKDGNNSLVPQLKSEIFLQKKSETFIRSILSTCDEVYAGTNYQDNLSAIIDIGAFFKNFHNAEVAAGILIVFPGRIDCVIYYNETSNQLEFILREGNRSEKSMSHRTGFLSSSDPESILRATGTDINRRFTYYDQRHITGSDILQPKYASALMTVGARVKIRDIFQGTLRMRQFMSSQKVFIVTKESSKDFFRSYIKGANTMRVSDILALGCINESEAQKVDNVQLAYMKIDNEIRKFILDQTSAKILNPKSGDRAESSLFKVLKHKFIRSVRENPKTLLQIGQDKDALVALNEYLESEMASLCAVLGDEHNDQIKVLNSKIKHEIIGSLDSTRNVVFAKLLKGRSVKTGNSNVLEGREVEYRIQSMTIQEINLDLELYSAKMGRYQVCPEVKSIDLKDFYVISTDPNADLYFKKTHKLSEIFKSNTEDTFKFYDVLVTSGEDIFLSSDICNFVTAHFCPNILAFSKYTWEGSHFLVQIRPSKLLSTGNDIRVTLLSKMNAEAIAKNLNSKEQCSYNGWIFWLCDLFGDIKFTTNHHGTEISNIMDLYPECANLIFDGLIFNGSIGVIHNSMILKNIYENIWLRHQNIKNRALFLLVRMNLLSDKFGHTVSAFSEVRRRLESAAMGNSENAYITGSTGIYVKPVSEKLLELQGGTRYTGISSSSEERKNYSLTDVFDQIFRQKFKITKKIRKSPKLNPQVINHQHDPIPIEVMTPQNNYEINHSSKTSKTNYQLITQFFGLAILAGLLGLLAFLLIKKSQNRYNQNLILETENKVLKC